jgi:hypothetical protein
MPPRIPSNRLLSTIIASVGGILAAVHLQIVMLAPRMDPNVAPKMPPNVAT